MLKPKKKVKKLRSQILCDWIVNNYKPCRVADVGGGKGLLTYLLNLHGFNSIVIDPIFQTLPIKYKDLYKKRHKIDSSITVPRMSLEFEPEISQKFDLLVGLHAHGSNMKIISSAHQFSIDFVILPCCVIDEPIVKEHGINWRESLITYANELNLSPLTIKLNFVGKDIAIYSKNFQTA